MDDNGSKPNSIFCVSSHMHRSANELTWSVREIPNRHGSCHLHDEISNECQNEEKQRFYGLSKNFERAKSF